jgi:hypothetical protein
MSESGGSSPGHNHETTGGADDSPLAKGRDSVEPPLTDHTKGRNPVAPPLTDHTKGLDPVLPDPPEDASKTG